jgi:putative tricarboxylic transport membrane protein
MMRSDTIAGAVFVAASLVGAALSYGFPTIAGQRFGPNLLPQLVFAGMAVGGFVLMLRKPPTDETAEAPLLTLQPGQLRFLLTAVGGLLVYGFALDSIGFIPLTLVYAALLARLSGASLKGSMLFAVACTFIVQWFFGTVMKVPLPPGLLR